MSHTAIRILVKSVALALAFVTGVACGDIGAALETEECFGKSDCGPLNCVVPNPNGLNVTGIGWCLESQTCVLGAQPFCPCTIDPGTLLPTCASDGDYNRMVPSTIACWDGTDKNNCLCLAEEACQYDPP